MKKAAIGALLLAAIAAAIWYLSGAHLALLDPAGLVAQKERDLLVLITALSMIIIVPVFALTAYVAWKYRETNTVAKHSPNWDYKPIVDVVWWTIPTVLIIVISIVIWTSTHDLDPYKPIVSSAPPIHIQVVAMDWKWLFIYPDQGIATLNFFEFPAGVPVDFEITSDAPMNSFWIPELGSQIYAMPSMSTELHLIASTTGTYSGSSANISGAGFSGMTFNAQSVTEADFQTWVKSVKASSDPLTADVYNTLAEPSSDVPAASYSWVDPGLYDKVMAKDMTQSAAIATGTEVAPEAGMSGAQSATGTMDMQGMNM